MAPRSSGPGSAYALLTATLRLVELFAQVPWASIPIHSFGLPGAMGYYAGVGSLTWLWSLPTQTRAILQRLVRSQLRASTVNDDRGQAHVLQKGQRGHQCIQIITQHRATHFDHRKTRGVELREALQILRDFLGTAHARQQPHDGLAGLRIVDGIRGQHRRHGVVVPDILF